MEVVPDGEIVVFDQLRSVFFLQEGEHLLPEAGHHGDVRNTCFMELTDQPFDQRLSIHFQQRFGDGMVDRHHAHAVACRKDDGVARLPLFRKAQCLFRQTVLLIDVSPGPEAFQNPVEYPCGVSAAC